MYACLISSADFAADLAWDGIFSPRTSTPLSQDPIVVWARHAIQLCRAELELLLPQVVKVHSPNQVQEGS